MITVEHLVKFVCEFITLESVSRQHYPAEGKNCTIHIGVKDATAEFPARKLFFHMGVHMFYLEIHIFGLDTHMLAFCPNKIV